MEVVPAQVEDFPGWLKLAAEVEPLFGPMVSDAFFHQTVQRNIQRGTAYCIREHDGPPGTLLVGAILFSPKPPLYKIGWLVITEKYRRQGAGRLLVKTMLKLVKPPAEIIVTTFGPDDEGGLPARRFYEQLGFAPAEIIPNQFGGAPRQNYRRFLRVA